MRVSAKALEALLKSIIEKTGLNLELDYNSVYGGYIIYLKVDDSGSIRTWDSNVRKSASAMNEFLRGVLVGLNFRY